MTTLRIPDLVFYGVALATGVSAAYVVFTRNIVRAVFALLGTFLGVAGIYGLLAADFVAVVQLMVYVGGILVLLLFAVMLTSQIETVQRSNRTGSWPFGLLLGTVLGVILISLAVRAPWRDSLPVAPAEPTTESIGRALTGPLFLPFMLVSLTILGAVTGAVTLARRQKSPEER